MNFANPIMLWSTLGIAVPIAIHLLNRQRYQHVKWAAMRFVIAAVNQNRRRIRAEDLLLLLLRCLLLLALAFAAARPFWKRFANLVPTGGVTAVIIVDDSSGMSGTDGVTTRFKSAQAAADAVVAALPTGSSAAVLMASDHVDPLVPEPTRDLTFVRRAMQQAAVSDHPPQMEPAVRRAIALLQKATGAKQLFIITDGRAGGWAPVEPITKLIGDAHDDVAAQVLLVGPPVTQNVGVSAIVPCGDLVPAGHPARFDVSVTNYGTVDAKQLPVRLSVDDEKTAESETTLDVLPAGQTRVVPLHATLPATGGAGPHWITASIPADSMPADDRRTIEVQGISSVHVLLVDGSEAHRGQPAGGDFVRAALRAVAHDPGQADFVQIEPVRPSDVTPAKLDKADLVIVVDANLSTAVATAIDHFVRDGGGLFFFPGPTTDTAKTTAELFDHVHLLPSQYSPGVGDAASQNSDLTLQATHFDHPIASIWTDPANGTPAAAHVFHHLPMTSPNPSEVVLAYSDGTPAVIDRPAGLGTVIQFGMSADTSWTDLPLRPAFLTLLYRSVAAVMANRDAGSNVQLGHAFTRRLPVGFAGRPVTVTDLSGKKSESTVALQGDSALLGIHDTDHAGGYTVSIASEPPMVMKFAAQPDPAGSRLEMLTDDQSAALSAVAAVRKWDDHAGTQLSGTGTSAGELWIVFAIAALVLTVVEPMAANWMSRSK
jgi:hypothetical protein